MPPSSLGFRGLATGEGPVWPRSSPGARVGLVGEGDWSVLPRELTAAMLPTESCHWMGLVGLSRSSPPALPLPHICSGLTPMPPPGLSLSPPLSEAGDSAPPPGLSGANFGRGAGAAAPAGLAGREDPGEAEGVHTMCLYYNTL